MDLPRKNKKLQNQIVFMEDSETRLLVLISG